MDTRVTPTFLVALGIVLIGVGSWFGYYGIRGAAIDGSITIGALLLIIGIIAGVIKYERNWAARHRVK